MTQFRSVILFVMCYMRGEPPVSFNWVLFAAIAAICSYLPITPQLRSTLNLGQHLQLFAEYPQFGTTFVLQMENTCSWKSKMKPVVKYGVY